MNFLAHALLAGDDDDDRIGGLLGDFVKGWLPAGLPPALAAGVALHRAIDSFADRHPAFIASRSRVSAARRRVAGVLVDLFYDHLLARDWADYGTGSLDDYTAGLYAALPSYRGVLPAPAEAVAKRMQDHDWLGAYRDVAAVGRAIDLMAVHRLRRPNALTGGIEEFLADESGFAADFRIFMPDALAFAAGWRAVREHRT
jgi:acyl carrier protein phosphodiesterase